MSVDKPTQQTNSMSTNHFNHCYGGCADCSGCTKWQDDVYSGIQWDGLNSVNVMKFLDQHSAPREIRVRYMLLDDAPEEIAGSGERQVGQCYGVKLELISEDGTIIDVPVYSVIDSDGQVHEHAKLLHVN